jgi:hypothetical protein
MSTVNTGREAPLSTFSPIIAHKFLAAYDLPQLKEKYKQTKEAEQEFNNLGRNIAQSF